MKDVTKKKLCWNCEGAVSLEEEICPFCGVSVIPASLDGTTHGFVPPYTPSYSSEEEKDWPPGYPSSHQPKEEDFSKDENQEAKGGSDEFKQVAIATTLLLSGSVFFLFGLALVLFSVEGTFTLHWDGSFWYLYLAFASILIYFGWKCLMKIAD